MKYIIIIMLALSLPATALVAPTTKDTKFQQTLNKKQYKKQETEELRKIIQKRAGRQFCDPEKELKMPTFY